MLRRPRAGVGARSYILRLRLELLFTPTLRGTKKPGHRVVVSFESRQFHRHSLFQIVQVLITFHISLQVTRSKSTSPDRQSSIVLYSELLVIMFKSSLRSTFRYKLQDPNYKKVVPETRSKAQGGLVDPDDLLASSLESRAPSSTFPVHIDRCSIAKYPSHSTAPDII